MIGKFIIVAVSLLLTACQSTPETPPQLVIAPGLEMDLPALAGPAKSFNATQMVVGTWRDRKFSLETHIERRGASLNVIALDTLGRRAMTIRWSNNNIKSTMASWLPEKLTADMMIAHMVLIYWPQQTLSAALHHRGIVIEQDGQSRQFLRDGQIIISVEYASDPEKAWNGKAQLVNSILDYRLTVQSNVLTEAD